MTDKYEDYSREDLIRLIHDRDRDLKPKLGLLWERDGIDHDRSVNADFVALDFDADLSCGDDPHQNLIIEGDNFDALRYLRMTHAGRVKCIYIDPPYNTGNRDFIYNDQFIEKDDSYRHSKWLEFMYRRLDLAKDLLSEDGVIFVSIDDIENAHLTLLMDKVFPGMRVGTFVWRRRSGANDSKDWFLSVDHEYVLCYANKGFTFAGTAKNLNSYSNPDGDDRGEWDSGDLNKAHNFKQRPDAFYPLHNPATEVYYPCDSGSVWRFATKARLLNGKKIRTKPIEQMIDEKRVLWPNDSRFVVYQSEAEIEAAIRDGSAPKNLSLYLTLDDLKRQVENGQAPERLLGYIEPLDAWVGRKIGYGKPRYKRFAKELKRTEQPVSTWILPSSMKKIDLDAVNLSDVTTFEVGFTSEGTTLLSQIVGNKDFPYPKPVSLIQALVGQATDGESGHVVIDFFAGSGTTGHAVLTLNDEDNGNRSFILVSSTEANKDEKSKNVCRDVTAKRLRAAVDGYSFRSKDKTVKVEGLGGEFAYLRTRRIPAETVFNRIQHDQVWTALQLIHVGEVSGYKKSAIIQTLLSERAVVIYAPTTSEAVIEMIKATLQDAGQATIYSWQPALLEQRIEDVRASFEPIPQYLVNRFGAGAKR
ncbi:MAG: site-specific DNA-methyltransferase [Gallionella sp.]